MLGAAIILPEIPSHFPIFELINFPSSMIYSKETVEGMSVILRSIFTFWALSPRRTRSGRSGCCVRSLYDSSSGAGDEGSLPQ